MKITHVLSSVVLTALSFFASQSAHAFPGMIRHGYVNCTSCHVQPTGGGALTKYGRELSGELMSTWAYEGEGKVFHGTAIDDSIPKFLSFGGDIRAIQTYKDTQKYTEKRFFLMQADLEVAARVGNFTVDGSAGVYDSEFNSLRHYIMYNWSEEGSLRVGRFRPAFGIYTTEHELYTKGKLGFGEESESYNIEAAYVGKSYNLFLTGIAGRLDTYEVEDGLSIGNHSGEFDRGMAARASVFLGEHYEIGASYYYGRNTLPNGGAHRHITGPFAILGFTPELHLESELDFQFKTANQEGATTVDGLFSYNRLDYEIIQGLHLFGTQELARSDFKKESTLSQRYGLGVQWLPRPHFEIEARWHKQQSLKADNHFYDFAWLLLHYYI